jgi:hypothetical protein
MIFIKIFHYYFALVAVGARVPVFVCQIYVIERRGLARRAGLRLIPAEIRKINRRLAHAEPFVYFQPCRFKKLIISLGIQRLARRHSVLYA